MDVGPVSFVLVSWYSWFPGRPPTRVSMNLTNAFRANSGMWVIIKSGSPMALYHIISNVSAWFKCDSRYRRKDPWIRCHDPGVSGNVGYEGRKRRHGADP